jgi:ATP-dependent Clp protease ATP-binding subunit ClpA
MEGLTDRARAVIVHAQEAARARHYSYVGTEHVLLGVLLTPGTAAEVLESNGVSASWATEKVAEIARETAGGEAITARTPFRGRAPFAPRVKTVLDRAQREAHDLGQDVVDAEHILLGLMLEHDGLVVHILLESGADPAKICAEVFRRLPSSAAQAHRPEYAAVTTSPPSIRVGSTLPTRRLLMVAAEQALDDRRAAFDAGDLLIALTRDETFAPVLAELDINEAVASEAIKSWRLPEQHFDS